jgi:hypothetical protein
MTTPYDEPMLSPWEEEGRRQAASLDGCGFVLVVGGDPLAAAELALGIGRVQARRRRVVVADAVGELGPIDDLGPMDAPYGIADVFVRGLPLEQAAHPADAAGNLHVLPSGAMPMDYGALLRSARWEGLSAEFREADALLLVVVPNEEPAVDALLPLVDGVVLLGRVQPLVGARVLLYVRGPGSGGHDMERVTGTITALQQPQHDTEPAASLARASTMRAVAPPPPPARRSSWPGWLGAFAVVALLAGGLWRSGVARRAAPVRSDTVPAETPLEGATAGAIDSVIVPESAAAAATAPVNAPPPAPAPDGPAPSPAVLLAQRAAAASADSDARAAGYAVEIAVTTNSTSANARLEDEMLKNLPALTVAPLAEPDGNRTFHVIAGAFRQRDGADSLLAALVASGTVIKGQGKVERLPFAVLVQSEITRDEASFYGAAYRSKGLAVYALLQEDGRMRLYAGAFERAQDAVLLASAFRATGETPIVTYRMGRLP